MPKFPKFPNCFLRHHHYIKSNKGSPKEAFVII